MSRPLRIAISGGGLAGATLFHALLQHDHLDVHIFESAKAFRDAGMAIGVTRNAQAALDLIGPSIVQALERAGAVAMRGVRFNVAEGEGQGTVVDQVDNTTDHQRLTSIVHRAALLEQLLAAAPQERMHASKKLQKVDREADGSVTLYFVDGTTHQCDILIGADGIHSVVRKLILGDDPAAAPRNSGAWCIMTLQPYAEAQSLLGKDSVDLEMAREYGWAGLGAFLLYNVLSNGELVQFVITGMDENVKPDQWRRTVTADEIRALYQGWPPRLSNAINKFLCSKPEQDGFYLWDHPPARTYVSGPICVMGDAAHATTPWQASGGGMSIEDSMILSTLLGQSRTPKDAAAALEAYDTIRRPRTQRIVESSRGTGDIFLGIGEGMTPFAKAPGTLMRRWDFILDLNMEAHRDEALAIFKEKLREA